MIRPQLTLDLNAELIVDNFAGGGGASTGIEIALGRYVDHAINHDKFALGMHRINHPQTVHHREDVFDIDPEVVCEGRRVGLAHFSPDCKHFSKAKGGKPLDKRIRGLVLVMLRWAKYGARVMTMENVEEIVTWGPLIYCDRRKGWFADAAHKGRTWRAFLDCLGTGIAPNHPDLPEILEVLAGTVTKAECVRGFGYTYEHHQIRACDHGTPTIRKRLFMVARNDGRPIVWPEATFRPAKTKARGLKPYRAIAECIDWELPCPSIFLTPAEAKKHRCKRPLAKATNRRIARGIDRFVLHAEEPFIVEIARRNSVAEGRDWDGDSVAPIVTEHANASHQRNFPADEPLRTQCGEVKGGHFALIGGALVQTGHGERKGQSPRIIDPAGPGLTAVATGNNQAVVSAGLVNLTHEGGDRCESTAEPIRAITGANRGEKAVVTGTLIGAGGPAYSGKPKPLDAPMNAQTTENHAAFVSATLVHTAHGEQDSTGKKRGRGEHSLSESMPSALGSSDCALAAASLVKLRGKADTHLNTASPADPADTICASGNHHGIVAAHLTKFTTGSVGQDLREPAPTVTAGSHSPDTHGGAATPQGMAVAYLAQHNGGFNETPGHEATKPLSTVSQKGAQQQVVAANAVKFYKTAQAGQDVSEPAHTVTTKHRLGLVESAAVYPMLTAEQIFGARRVAAFLREHGVEFEGEFATVAGYIIVDIGMRMLTPRELFRAQGFGDAYIIDRAWVIDEETGELAEIKLTKEQQIRMCGNSVCPQPYGAIVRANVPDLASWYRGEKRLRKALLN